LIFVQCSSRRKAMSPVPPAMSSIFHPSEGEEEEIPGLSLGEPEEAVPEGGEKKEKAVHLKGEEHVGLSQEELEKHRKFEELRKKHYEMKDVANLLGHPEDLDDADDDGDDDMNGTAR